MTARRNVTTSHRPLAIFGVSEAEEQVYRCLLDHPGSRLRELSELQRLSERNTQRLLQAIEARGLVTHTPEHPRRYYPATPDIAIDALILKHQGDLQRARTLALELQERVEASRRDNAPEQIVEIVSNRDAERLVFEQTCLSARREIITLNRLPMRISSLQPPYDFTLLREGRARNVAFRSIVDSECLNSTNMMDYLQQEMQLGVIVRVVHSLPLKMVLVDRSVALIPLHLEKSDSPALLVRSPPLLDALSALFDVLWERGTPINRKGEMLGGDLGSRFPKGLDDLTSLLAAGLNDKAIAHQLGMSARTFERRIVSLMKTFGARSRFQAGWRAALRWVAAKRPGKRQ